MKKSIICSLLVLSFLYGNAQNPLSQSTQINTGFSYVPFNYYNYSNGLIENRGLGYDILGSGIFSTYSVYKPIKFAKGLMYGGMIEAGQFGLSRFGAYQNARYLGAGMSFKYYPFEKINLYVQLDVVTGSIMSNSLGIPTTSDQIMFYSNNYGNTYARLKVGYEFKPFNNKNISIGVSVSGVAPIRVVR